MFRPKKETKILTEFSLKQREQWFAWQRDAAIRDKEMQATNSELGLLARVMKQKI